MARASGDYLATDSRAEPHGDYFHVGSDEPHASRRVQILKAHPEITKLYGPDIRTALCCVVIVATQVAAAYTLRSSPWISILFWAYCLGGVMNHSATLAMHEISHNLAFSSPLLNQMCGFFVNLPLAIPSCVTFKRYHLDHHMYQGSVGVDTDIPSKIETQLVTNSVGKAIFCFLQPAFYALRPLLIKPKPRTNDEYINIAVQLLFDQAIYRFFGGKALAYLLLSSLFGLGFHPMAGHFISEHYVMITGYETYSYYGPLNWVSFFVGYHNEHHDFPRVSGWNLHKIRAIAHEFYEDLPHHSSWARVIWLYISDPKVGPFARIMRNSGERALAGEDKLE
jgi:sphingolipid delta-4 desaturase